MPRGAEVATFDLQVIKPLYLSRMHQVSLTDLWRGGLNDAVERAAQGETIVITRFGAPKALLMPLSAAPPIPVQLGSSLPPPSTSAPPGA